MSNNYHKIDISLCTTKPIKIENTLENIIIYDNEIDNTKLKINYTILVKDQTSHYLNNIYIIHSIDDNKYKCKVYNNKNNNNNKLIYVINFGDLNKNKKFILSNNKYNNIYINIDNNNNNNINKIIKINDTIMFQNTNYNLLKHLYSVDYYLYYLKSIPYFNKLNDNHIKYYLNNNNYLNKFDILMSQNKKFFLTINNYGYLILYQNKYTNNNISNIIPKWIYSDKNNYPIRLYNNKLLFDNNNDLILKKKYNSKNIIINKLRYKYIGSIINQTNSYNTISKHIKIPDIFELYQNDNNHYIYLDSKTYKQIFLTIHNININIIKLLIPKPEHILHNNFESHLKFIQKEIQINNLTNINDIYCKISNILDNTDVQSTLLNFLNKDIYKNYKTNNLSSIDFKCNNTMIESKQSINSKLNESDKKLYINYIISYIHKTPNLIVDDNVYIFDINTINEQQFSKNKDIKDIIDILKDNNKYYFKLEQNNNFMFSENQIIINNNGYIEQILSNNISIWNNNNETLVKSINDNNKPFPVIPSSLLKELVQALTNEYVLNLGPAMGDWLDKADLTPFGTNGDQLVEELENSVSKARLKSGEDGAAAEIAIIRRMLSQSGGSAINDDEEENEEDEEENEEDEEENEEDEEDEEDKENEENEENEEDEDKKMNLKVDKYKEDDLKELEKKRQIKINNNTKFIYPFLCTNYISSSTDIKYNNLYNYILIDNPIKINTFLKSGNTYSIYIVISLIYNENLIKTNNQQNRSNNDKDSILDTFINNIEVLTKNNNFTKYYKELYPDHIFNNDTRRKGGTHIVYLDFKIKDTDIYELILFSNIYDIFNIKLHHILIFNKDLNNIEQKINVYKYLNKKWSIYLNKNKNYDKDAFDYIIYNNSLICNIECININKLNKKLRNLDDTESKIETKFVINYELDKIMDYYSLNINEINIEHIYNYVFKNLSYDINNIKNSDTFYDFVNLKIKLLKKLNTDNNSLLYQIKHLLPYLEYNNLNLMKNKNLLVSEIKNNINNLSLKFIPNSYNINFLILVINQKNKNNNGLYIRNYNNSFTKLFINLKNLDNKIFYYADIYKSLAMPNIILNKVSKSNLLFKLYEEKINKLFSKLNYNDINYTVNTNNIFNKNIIDYINKKNIIFVDLATTKYFNINKKTININELPDYNCNTCNISNLIKIRENYMYILVKNNRNQNENGIYSYTFIQNNTLKLREKLSFNYNYNINNILIYIVNGNINKNELYSINYKKYNKELLM